MTHILAVTFAAILFAHFYDSKLLRSVVSLQLFIANLFFITFFVAYCFTGEGINSAFLYHLHEGVHDAGFTEFLPIILATLLLVLIALAISIAFYKYSNKIKKLKNIKAIIVPEVILLLATCFLVSNELQLDKLAIFQPKKLAAEPLDLSTVPKIQAPKTKRNAVFIFLESYEATLLDIDKLEIGTNIKELAKQGELFTHLCEFPNTNWTTAGMTAGMCGMPFMEVSFETKQNYSKTDAIYNDVVCVPDILKTLGYHVSFIQGTPTKFGAIDKLLIGHNFDKIIDNYSIENYASSEDSNSWGINDDVMFDNAFQIMERHAKLGKPTMTYLSTFSTHAPGHISRSCDVADNHSKISKAYKCSDIEVYNFIQKIWNTPWGKDTVFFLASDHLIMKNKMLKEFTGMNRHLFFLTLDPLKKYGKENTKIGSMLDVPSTMLHKIGIDYNVGMGINLLSDEMTAMERMQKHLPIKRIVAGYPKLNDLTFDKKSGLVTMGNRRIKAPFIARIDKEENVILTFDSKVFTTTYQSYNDYKLGEPFIWIDHKIKTLTIGRTGGAKKIFDLTKSNEFKITKNEIQKIFDIPVKQFVDDRAEVTLDNMMQDEAAVLRAIPKGSVYYTKDLEAPSLANYLKLTILNKVPKNTEFYARAKSLRKVNLNDFEVKEFLEEDFFFDIFLDKLYHLQRLHRKKNELLWGNKVYILQAKP